MVGSVLFQIMTFDKIVIKLSISTDSDCFPRIPFSDYKVTNQRPLSCAKEAVQNASL